MKRCSRCNSLMPNDVTQCIRCGFDSAFPVSPVASNAAALVAPLPDAPRMGSWASGWALARESWRLLLLDKELLLFPLMSGIASFLVLASFFGGVWASGMLEREQVDEVTAWVVLFLYYFANYFVIVFFNSGLVACAMIRFRGGDPTVGDGLRAARERVAHIVAWAALAATVGVVLRMIEERVGFVGKIVIAILGAVWTIATYFVVPVLVVEGLGPLDAAKRSAGILKKAWGESLVSNIGVGLVVTVVTILIAVPVGLGFLLLALQTASLAVAVTGVVVLLAIFVLSALIGSALGSITLCALYLFATEGKVPQAFAAAGVQHAFAPKR